MSKISAFITHSAALGLTAVLAYPAWGQAGTSTPVAAQISVMRPSGVPKDYLPTPFGWVAEGCIVAGRKGELLARTIERARLDKTPCAAERYNSVGDRIAPKAKGEQLAATDGYQAMATVDLPVNYETAKIETHIVVPENPTLKGNQNIYLNTGVHDRSDLSGDLYFSTVSWNMKGVYKGWNVSIWYDANDFTKIIYTDPVKVEVGDRLSQHVDMSQNSGGHNVKVYVRNVDTGDIVTESDFNDPSIKQVTVINIGMDNYTASKCTYLPDGNVINYPLFSTRVSSSGGQMQDITGDVTADPPPKINKCNIVLELDSGAESARAR